MILFARLKYYILHINCHIKKMVVYKVSLRKNIFIILLMVLIYSSIIQGKNRVTLDSIINQTQARYGNIENFQSQGTLSIDIPKISISNKKVNIYYSKPGKINIDSKGFTIVPNLSFYPLLFFDTGGTNIEIFAMNQIDSNYVFSIRTSCFQDSAELWIDTTQFIISKIVSKGPEGNYLNISINYGTFNNTLLPDNIVFNFRLNKSIPEFSPPSIKRPFGETQLFKDLLNESISGSMTLKIFDYKFNLDNLRPMFNSDSVSSSN